MDSKQTQSRRQCQQEDLDKDQQCFGVPRKCKCGRQTFDHEAEVIKQDFRSEVGTSAHINNQAAYQLNGLRSQPIGAKSPISKKESKGYERDVESARWDLQYNRDMYEDNVRDLWNRSGGTHGGYSLER